MKATDNDQADGLIALTSDIVAAHVTNNKVEVADLPALIQNVFGALQGLGATEPVEERPAPAVSVRASVKPDYLVCLEDGKKMKMLKRYLMTQYGMTPDQYRQRWNLPADYPMVAPEYAEKRRALAKDIGLGRKPGERPAQRTAQKPGRKPKAVPAAKAAEPV
ncbi:MucR family transcriptional regulator [Croceicoccus marinus]|uniref:MucR family transcriptional regulator n=1 Tax=Croceicoccus marinus TaxID=450378 RepID=A0A7G6W181_9SPHN|nr:MucR family transcriptional regulator [Croceicoccus marinus]QNE07746.1 MucR family transcriptional regulator [Croceicoccus marinus]